MDTFVLGIAVVVDGILLIWCMALVIAGAVVGIQALRTANAKPGVEPNPPDGQ